MSSLICINVAFLACLALAVATNAPEEATKTKWTGIDGMVGEPLPADKYNTMCNLPQPSTETWGDMCKEEAMKSNSTLCSDTCNNIGFDWFSCATVFPFGSKDPRSFNVCGCSDTRYGNYSKLWYFITSEDLPDDPKLNKDQHCGGNNPLRVLYTKDG